MLAYEKLGEGGGSGPEITDIPRNIQERLYKVGIAIESGTFRRLAENPSIYEMFLKDLTTIEVNPSEKGRFELLYLKGFGQLVDTQFGKLSFAEIQTHPKRTDILDGMKEEDYSSYNSWQTGKVQVAIARIDTEKAGEQVAIKEGDLVAERKQVFIETANRLEKELQTSTDAIRSISSLPKDLEKEALLEAQKNPPKELTGIPPEKYGDYKNLILAHHVVINRDTLLQKIRPEDQERFDRAIRESGKILGREIVQFRKLTESIVLGSGREQVETRGRELIGKGYSKEVVWNANDRTITFTNTLGEKRIIETASIPPRERMERNGLSISRDILPVDNSVEKKRNFEETQKEKRGEVASDYAGLKIIQSGSFPKELKDEGVRHAELYSVFNQARTPEARYDTLSDLLASNRAIEVRRRGKMTPENMEVIGQFEKPIQDERVTLERLLKSLTAYIAGERELSKYANIPNRKDTFDSTARTNLDWLTSDEALFQRMGPNATEILEKIIAEINREESRTEANRMSLTKLLDRSDKDRLKEKLVKLGGTLDILRSDKVSDFQKKMNSSIAKENPSDPDSIEGLLRASSKSETA